MTHAPGTRPIRQRTAVLALLAVMALTIVAVVLAVLSGQTDERIFATCASVGVSCMLGFLAVWVVAQGRQRRLAIFAVVLGALDLVAINCAIWMFRSWAFQRAEEVAGALAIAAFIAVGCLLIAVAGSFRFRVWWWHIVPVLSISTVVLLVCGGSMAIIFNDKMEQMVGRVGDQLVASLVALGLLLTVTSLLALPLLRILERMPTARGEGGMRGGSLPVRMECPRCLSLCVVSANSDGTCPQCRLSLRVEFEEPRCACGYLLHHLQAPMCPECGALVTVENNWQPQPVTPQPVTQQSVTPPSGPRST